MNGVIIAAIICGTVIILSLIDKIGRKNRNPRINQKFVNPATGEIVIMVSEK